MVPHVSVVRAIGAEFLRRKINGIFTPIGIVVALAFMTAVWLTTVSAWWWVLDAVVAVLAILCLLIYLSARRVASGLRPAMTKSQVKNIKGFVDKFERVTDNFTTPKFIIAFRIVRDMTFPRHSSYIQSVATDSTTLHKDYLELVRNLKS